MASNYVIHALMVGIAESWRRSGITPCLRSEIGSDDPVPYIVWTLQGPGGVVTVDTGYHPDYVARGFAEGKNFIEPAKLLSEIGLKVDDVKTVVVTHFHQDHFTGFDFFPSAKFVIQRAEYEFWTGPLMRYEYLNRLIRPKVRPALAKMIDEKRVQFVDGDVELQPGLEVLRATGHTPGSQMAAVQTSSGKAVICGDVAFTYRSLREHVPTGFYHDLAGSIVDLDRAMTTATRPELVYPSHDAVVMQGKRVIRLS